MRIRSIPPNTLAAVAALLGPYAADASPATIIEALKAHGTGAPADPACRRLLSLREAGRALGVSEWTCRRLVLAGKLPSVKVGSQWRVPLAAIEALSQADAE